MRKYLMLLAALAMVTGAASTAAATDWVLDRDFSKTTNPNGQWTYGVYLADSFDPTQYPGGWFAWPTYYD